MLFENRSGEFMHLNAVKDDHHDLFEDNIVMVAAVFRGSEL